MDLNTYHFFLSKINSNLFPYIYDKYILIINTYNYKNSYNYFAFNVTFGSMYVL